MLRPQIRHVHTIRIAKEREDVDSKDAHATTNVLVSQAKGWGFLDGSNHLAILSTKGIAEFTIPQGAQIQAWKLPSGTQFAKRPSLSKPNEGEGYTTIDRWDWLPWRVNIGRFENGKRFAIVGNPDLSLYELDAGAVKQIELPRSLRRRHVVAYSQNGRFAVVALNNADHSTATLSIWDLKSLKLVREFQADRYEIESSNLLITNDARHIQRHRRPIVSCGGWGRGRGVERFSGIRNTSLLYEEPMISNDGNWILYAETLEMPNGGKISLEQFAKAFDVGILDPEHYRLALVFDPSDRLSSSSEGEFSSTRAPILETLIENPRSALLGLFDPATRRTRTSWTPPGLLRGLEWRSPKFTPDGRYLIIQDEDESADLFHVFAMP